LSFSSSIHASPRKDTNIKKQILKEEKLATTIKKDWVNKFTNSATTEITNSQFLNNYFIIHK